LVAKKFDLSQIILMFLVTLFCIFCLVPFIMVISGSFSTEKDIYQYGYTLIPRHPTLLSYKILLVSSARVINAYKVSIIVTVCGTLLGLIVNALGGYAMARRTLKYRNILSMYALLTIMFNGGLVPWYIVCVNYLHLKDTLYALILPAVANAFYMYLIRNYLLSIPEELYESAKIEGSGEWRIFVQIILPLAKPVLATIGLFFALQYWNDWFLGLMYTDKQELQPLQLILRVIINNIDFLRNSTNAAEMQRLTAAIPSQGVKMAATIITIGPIVFVYPFLQKFFIKGIMVGAVKG
jgi:putative aldouronate transport system permease protein